MAWRPISSITTACSSRANPFSSCISHPVAVKPAAHSATEDSFVPACRSPLQKLFTGWTQVATEPEIATAIRDLLARWQKIFEIPDAYLKGRTDAAALAEAHETFLERHAQISEALYELLHLDDGSVIYEVVVEECVAAYADNAAEYCSTGSSQFDLLLATDHYARAGLILKAIGMKNRARGLIYRAFTLLERHEPQPYYPYLILQIIRCFDSCGVTRHEQEMFRDTSEVMLTTAEDLAQRFKQPELIREIKLYRQASLF